MWNKFAVLYNANILLIVFSGASLFEMEVELELLTNEKDAIQVMQKAIDLAKKARELGFSIKELELESEEDEEKDENEE